MPAQSTSGVRLCRRRRDAPAPGDASKPPALAAECSACVPSAESASRPIGGWSVMANDQAGDRARKAGTRQAKESPAAEVVRQVRDLAWAGRHAQAIEAAAAALDATHSD